MKVIAPNTNAAPPQPNDARHQSKRPAAATRIRTGPRLPTLIVYDIDNVKSFRALVRTAVKDQNIRIAYSESMARVTVKTAEDYKALWTLLKSEDAQVSSWATGKDKTTAFQFLGLSPKHSADDLVDDLQAEGILARRARQIQNNGHPSGIFVVAISTTEVWTISAIKRLRSVGNQRVSVRLHYYRGPQMCHRCSRFGHSSYFCSAMSRCMECAGPHMAAECNSEIKKCANCGQAHPAYSPDCVVRQAEKEKEAARKKRKGKKPLAAQPPGKQKTPLQEPMLWHMATLSIQNSWAHGSATHQPWQQRPPRRCLDTPPTDPLPFPNLPVPNTNQAQSLKNAPTQGKIQDQKWRKEGAVLSKRVSAFTPSSVFVESLLEQLCKIFEKDPPSQKKLYELICQKLYAMKLIDKTYKVEEFQVMRNYYQQALFHLLTVSNSSAIDSKIESFLNQSPSHLSLPLTISSGAFHRSRYQDEFEEIGYIARGGFGRVYRVRHKIDGCEYAVKKICLRYHGDDQFMRALREVRTLAKLDHPNIVAYKAAWFEPVNSTGEDCSSSSGSKITPDSEVPDSSISQRESRDEGEDESGDIVFANGNEGASGLVLGGPGSNSNPIWKEVGQFPKVDDYHMRTRGVKMVNVPENQRSLCDHNSGSSNKGCRGWKVPGTGCGVGRAVLHIQMQLCKESLRKWLDLRNEVVQPAREQDSGTLLNADGVATALHIFLGILEGVEYMHSMRVVHHDLKPSNIFVEGYEYMASSSVETEDTPPVGNSRGGRCRCQVRVGDFGLACHLANPPATVIDNGMRVAGDGGEEATAMAVVPKDTVWGGGSCLVQNGGAALGGDEEAKEVIGTRLYAAPEQLEGRCNLMSDMYSLGIILFELLHPFFTAMERGIVIAAMRSCGNVPEEFLHSHPKLASLIKDMLSENPSNRPPVQKIREVVQSVLSSYGSGVLRNRNDSVSSDDDISVKEYVVKHRSRNSSFTQTYGHRECEGSKFQSLDEFYFEENQVEVGECCNYSCNAIREQQGETINRLRAENLKKDELIEELRVRIMKLESSSKSPV